MLCINDLPGDIMSSIKIFADDTKALKDVQTGGDMLILQKDVDSLCQVATKIQCKKMYTRGVCQPKENITV